MNKRSDMEFKIGMVAPSRIGKTSLVTAILNNAQDLLAGTPVSIKANDSRTNARINQHKNELRGSLRAKEFDTGAMSGTQEPFEFSLLLNHGDKSDSNGLKLRLLDFPGGWMSDIQQEFSSSEASSDRAKCARFIKESSVLLVVVDASLIMEASGPSQNRAIDGILNVAQTEDIVRGWAKARAKNSSEPALLLICPVKCESYFNDNGGHKDQADLLCRKIIEEVYSELLPIINSEGANQADILYIPVDTVGCVEFVSANWQKNDLADGGYTVDPHFKVRGKGVMSVKGADDVLIAIAKQIISAETRLKDARANDAFQRAHEAHWKAMEEKSLVAEIATFLFDYKTDAEQQASDLRSEARKIKEKARELGTVMAALAGRQFGSRVRAIRKGEWRR